MRTPGKQERMLRLALAPLLAFACAAPASAQQVASQIRAGVLTCDVAGGTGLIVTSRKPVSCAFVPEGRGRREDYDGEIRRYGLDLGFTGGGVMLWAVFTNTVAGPGFLAGDYVGASGEVTV